MGSESSKQCHDLGRRACLLSLILVSFHSHLSAQDFLATVTRPLQDQAPQRTLPKRDRSQDPAEFLGPDGKPLPFASVQEVIEFLKTGEVIRSREVGEGTTGVKKMLLEKDGKQMHAVFRDVHIFKQLARFADGSAQIGFRDDANFELAAYELNRVLDLRLVPPVVPRRIEGNEGTLQAWLEQAMMEKERQQRKLVPPDLWWWRMQHQLMYLFDNLIRNEDRHSGNLMFTPAWRMVLIDHTRSFGLKQDLLSPSLIFSCERSVFEKLKGLNSQLLNDRLRPYLSKAQIKSLLKRRDRLVEHIEGLIEERGEARVLFGFPN